MIAAFGVTFGEHLSSQQVASFTSQLAAFGLLASEPEPFDLVVQVRRDSHVPGLKDQLTKWERWGFLRWSEVPTSE